MAGNWSYERLSAIHESQDIADVPEDPYNSQWTLQPLQEPSPPPVYSSVELGDLNDRKSLRSFNTDASSSSSTGSSIEKFKKGWNRIRRKPVPGYLKGSIRRHPAAEIQPQRIGRGAWKDQLLIDRSLRGMAALTTLFAIAILIVVATHMKAFYHRANKYTSSVGGRTTDCKSVTQTNTALLLLINVAATMILGMSNTYQQLITSLTINDLKHMLQKFGDGRVGTNSPFSINHKSEGKGSSWLAWLLLIGTSLPVHFLANSLIGPSYIMAPPTTVQYNRTSWESIDHYGIAYAEDYITGQSSFVCWSAFRTGKAHFPQSLKILSDNSDTFGGDMSNFGIGYSRIVVSYTAENCTGLANSTSDVARLEASYSMEYDSIIYGDGECQLGKAVYCSLYDSEPAKCRLNVRMNAAFVLMGCLIVKAIYMVAVNLIARGKLKRHCLTFGDVIVASASHPELRVQGECMVNANDSYRRHSSHTCHKHCKSKDESKTGDELGHCQKCKKWNSANKFSNLPQPTIATKIKKSLISNLGNTALTQMLILMFCSFVMLSVSIFVAVAVGTQYHSEIEQCKEPEMNSYYDYCNMSSTTHFAEVSGGFGGFNRSLTAASLQPDQLGNEFISFCISNGAQFIYSLLYLMLIYNITLVSQEFDWGKLEKQRKRLRCTIVKGESFSQDYLLQLPKKILFPIMAYSVLTHWMIGEALQTQEAIWLDDLGSRHVEHSKYIITYAAYPLWIATFLILLMTSICWWAYTYKREGFIPQMFGSIRTLCAATTQLDDFPSIGIQWGDLGMGRQFRHAGLSAEDVMKIVPNELYAGLGVLEEKHHPCIANTEREPLLLRCEGYEEVEEEDTSRTKI